MGGHFRLSDPSVKRCDDALSLPRKFADRLRWRRGRGKTSEQASQIRELTCFFRAYCRWGAKPSGRLRVTSLPKWTRRLVFCELSQASLLCWPQGFPKSFFLWS